MARKSNARTNTGNAVTEARFSDGLMNTAPVSYSVADTTIIAMQLYHNPDRRPADDGPWNNEADKVAWVDEETGLGCIMLRQKDGTISGYVGVGPEHPLFGYEADAVPVGVSTTVHGGVTYGKACEVNRFARKAWGKPREERYTVCHTTYVRAVQEYRTVQTTDDEFHEDLWWLGFDTAHPGDLVPNARHGEGRKGDVYRDQSFVYANCMELARKLKSLIQSDPGDDEGADGQRILSPPFEMGGE